MLDQHQPATVLATTPAPRVDRLWAELTGRCQLACVHCYAESGPDKGHGRMTATDWMRVIDEANTLGASPVQFIGGEPTMHPHFAEILRHAVRTGIGVEVYSNLVHISDEVWKLLRSPTVSLAFSYYSDLPEQHNAVTARPSHAATRRHVVKLSDTASPSGPGSSTRGPGRYPVPRQICVRWA